MIKIWKEILKSLFYTHCLSPFLFFYHISTINNKMFPWRKLECYGIFPPPQCLSFLSPFHDLRNEKKKKKPTSLYWFEQKCLIFVSKKWKQLWFFQELLTQSLFSPNQESQRLGRAGSGRPVQCTMGMLYDIAKAPLASCFFSYNNCLSFRFQCFPFVFTITEGCFIAFHQAGCHGDQQLLYAVKITLLPW